MRVRVGVRGKVRAEGRVGVGIRVKDDMKRLRRTL